MAKGAAGGRGVYEGTRKTANACTQGEARGALRAYPSRDEGSMVLDKSERRWTYIEVRSSRWRFFNVLVKDDVGTVARKISPR
jgi:hypothetical protein